MQKILVTALSLLSLNATAQGPVPDYRTDRLANELGAALQETLVESTCAEPERTLVVGDNWGGQAGRDLVRRTTKLTCLTPHTVPATIRAQILTEALRERSEVTERYNDLLLEIDLPTHLVAQHQVVAFYDRLMRAVLRDFILYGDPRLTERTFFFQGTTGQVNQVIVMHRGKVILEVRIDIEATPQSPERSKMKLGLRWDA